MHCTAVGPRADNRHKAANVPIRAQYREGRTGHSLAWAQNAHTRALGDTVTSCTSDTRMRGHAANYFC
jgi:hypothetical protein